MPNGKGRRPRAAKNRAWREASVIVKKTHPFAKTKEDAREVAERHAKKAAKDVIEDRKAFRALLRPKTCFEAFRGQKRGQHVTVFWGKVKEEMKKKPECNS